jgi:2-methylisocitrate lyase-like PEP mutase family enzyme
MATQSDKCRTFRALHERPGAFIMPNPWDVGSARLLEHLGFEALATTSAGFAYSLGMRDNAPDREMTLEHCREIVEAVDVPVSADLGNCFGDKPEVVAETIRRAARTGLAGCSVEDSTQRADDPIYGFELSVDRVRAAVEVVRSLPFPFTLTARCENYLHGRHDLDDTIKRLKAYEEAGANVLFAPGVSSLDDLRRLIRSVGLPVNVIGGGKMEIGELAGIGVKRISTGGALYRAALTGVARAAEEMRDKGTFSVLSEAISHVDSGAIVAR